MPQGLTSTDFLFQEEEAGFVTMVGSNFEILLDSY